MDGFLSSSFVPIRGPGGTCHFTGQVLWLRLSVFSLPEVVLAIKRGRWQAGLVGLQQRGRRTRRQCLAINERKGGEKWRDRGGRGLLAFVAVASTAERVQQRRNTGGENSRSDVVPVGDTLRRCRRCFASHRGGCQVFPSFGGLSAQIIWGRISFSGVWMCGWPFFFFFAAVATVC